MYKKIIDTAAGSTNAGRKFGLTLIFIDDGLGSYYMHGGWSGSHTIHNSGNSVKDTSRMIAHWKGYIENNTEVAA